jgi:hypothetical protein
LGSSFTTTPRKMAQFSKIPTMYIFSGFELHQCPAFQPLNCRFLWRIQICDPLQLNLTLSLSASLLWPPMFRASIPPQADYLPNPFRLAIKATHLREKSVSSVYGTYLVQGFSWVRSVIVLWMRNRQPIDLLFFSNLLLGQRDVHVLRGEYTIKIGYNIYIIMYM